MEGLVGVLPGDVLLGLAFIAAMLVLALVARLHPLVALALGVVLLGVPIAQWVFFEQRWFQSEGSAAGLVFFFVYAGVGFVCALLGLALAAQGAFGLARGSGRRILSTGAAAFVATLIVAAAIAAPAWYFRDKPAPRPARAPAIDAPALAPVTVTVADAARCEAAARETKAAFDRGAAKPDAINTLSALCGGVVRDARARLPREAKAAAEPMLRALEARLALGIGIREHMPDLDALIASLAAESREAAWAQALRAWDFSGSTAPGAKRAARESLDVALPLAPRVLAADDRVFEAVYRAASAAAVDDAFKPATVELMRAWDAKAAAAAPGSDLALQVRFRLCRERLAANLERETLRACAEDLAAAWERRIAESKGFEPFFSEVELAMHIARMYVSHAWAVGDFAAGAAGVRRVRERAATRFSSPQYDDVRQALQKMEAELAAKAGGAR